MSSTRPASTLPDPVESALRQGLARGDAVLGSVTPVLRHFLVHDSQPMFEDAVLARVRGMIADLANQFAPGLAAGTGPVGEAGSAALTADLAQVPGVLDHCHALALEGLLTETLKARLNLDPVVPPLIEALLGSEQGETSTLAMKVLAAQARFVQQHAQMRLPLSELPADLMHTVLQALTAHDPGGRAVARLRARYDESASRIALLARLVTGMGSGAVAGLLLGHAGPAIFASALALTAGLHRDHCILLMQPGQAERLALVLRADAMKPAAIEGILLLIDPGRSDPIGIGGLAPERAAAILDGTRDEPAFPILTA
jgi:hypothetical protein